MLQRRMRALRDRLQSSLFWIPMAYAIGGVLLARAMLRADEAAAEVPRAFMATVDSARAVLGVIAGATVGFSGVAFSVSLLLFSMSASQYSPRVVHGLFRDPFNKRIMGIVLGTFTYCLIVLAAVHSPLSESDEAVVPSISVVVAVGLGVITLLAIVAFIDHGAHTMDVSAILHRTCSHTVTEIELQWSTERPAEPRIEAPDRRALVEEGGALVVRHEEHGWIQSIQVPRILEAIAPGATVYVDTRAGHYAVSGTPFATVVPRPDDAERVSDALRAAVQTGESRTMHDDATYGLRQLVDVALKALSPGVNDPTTAQDALFHVATVLREFLAREPPAQREFGDDDRSVMLTAQPTHETVVSLAFDEARLAAATQPAVLLYLLEVIHLVSDALPARRGDACRPLLATQASLIRDLARRADLLPDDRDRVEASYRQRFETEGNREAT